MPPRRRRRYVPPAALIGALAVIAGVVLFTRTRTSAPPEPVPPAETTAPAAEDTTAPFPPPRTIDRPGLGFSLELPPGWIVQPSDPSGGVFLATSGNPGPPSAWVRVFKYAPGESAAAVADRVMAGLLAVWQAEQVFSRATVEIYSTQGILVQFKLPLHPDGSGPVTHQSYYFFPATNGPVGFALGTLDPSQYTPVLEAIASSLRVS